MYKKAKRYDAMVRLVAKHRPDVLKETNQFLAQQLEMEGSLKDAEHHYAEAGEWLSAVNMCVCFAHVHAWMNRLMAMAESLFNAIYEWAKVWPNFVLVSKIAVTLG